MIDAIAGLIGGEQAEDAQAAASRAARRQQQELMDEAYRMTRGTRDIGNRAFGTLANLYGLNPSGRPNMDLFVESPDYQFNLQQGLGALEKSAAARGGLYSGQAMKAAQRFGSGLASQQFSDYFNRMSGIANTGQNATQNLLNLRAGVANNMGNLLTQQGQNRADMIAGQWQGFGDLAGGLAGAAMGGMGGGGAMGALKGMFGM